MHGLDEYNIHIYNSFSDGVSKNFMPNCERSVFVSSLFSCEWDGWTELPPLHPFLLKPHSLCMSDAFILPQQFVQKNLAIIYHYHNFGRKSIGINTSARSLGCGLLTRWVACCTTSQVHWATGDRRLQQPPCLGPESAYTRNQPRKCPEIAQSIPQT